MDLTISRAEWLRGDNQSSMLLRPADGLRCCVGIYLRACGVSDASLSTQGEACEVPDLPDAAGWLTDSRNTASRLYTVNDDPELPEGDRERTIAALFAEHGVTVTFTE